VSGIQHLITTETAPSPQPSPPRGEGEREQIAGCANPEFDWISQLGVSRTFTPVSPLSLRERVRVRAFFSLS
jgi:hypothetical protein